MHGLIGIVALGVLVGVVITGFGRMLTGADVNQADIFRRDLDIAVARYMEAGHAFPADVGELTDYLDMAPGSPWAGEASTKVNRGGPAARGVSYALLQKHEVVCVWVNGTASSNNPPVCETDR